MFLTDALLEALGPAGPQADARVRTEDLYTGLLVGDLRRASDGRELSVTNPATGEVIGSASDASPDEARAAVECARAAVDSTSWSHDVALRTQCLGQLVDGLQRGVERLRTALISEIGCPVRMTHADQLQYAIDKLAAGIEVMQAYPFVEPLPERTLGGVPVRRAIHRVPVGVVAAITPWNLPLELMLAKVSGALAGGNAIILKPSPLAPWTAAELARIVAEETDIPSGIVAVVTSSRVETVEVLTTSPRVDAVAFTGSTRTGRRVMEAASATVKRVCLELGGKSPSVFLPDAPLADVLPFAAGMAMFNAGQSCIMPSRFLVPRDRLEEAVELAGVGAAAVPAGDPWSAGTFLGPLITDQHRVEVQRIVDDSVGAGARVAAGGSALPGPGYGYAPTILVDEHGTSPASREEIFGPVVTMTPYRDVEHALELANSTEFGLAGYVWSADVAAAEAFGSRIAAGMIGVNGGMFTDADMPFGGVKSSGIGREWGRAGLEEFLDWQTRAVRG